MLLARQLGEREPLVDALRAEYFGLYATDPPKSRLAVIDEILRLLGGEQTERRVEALLLRMQALLEMGDIERYDADYATATQLADQLYLRSYQATLRAVRPMRTLLRSEFDAAEAQAYESIATGEAGELGMLALATQLFAIRMEQGRLAELEAMITSSVQQFSDVPAMRVARRSCSLTPVRSTRRAESSRNSSTRGFLSSRPEATPAARWCSASSPTSPSRWRTSRRLPPFSTCCCPTRTRRPSPRWRSAWARSRSTSAG